MIPFRRVLYGPNLKDPARHVLFWICYFVFCYLTDNIIYSAHSELTELILFSIQNLYLFYGLYYFLNNLSIYSGKDRLAGAIRFLGIVSFFFALRHISRYYLLPGFLGPEHENADAAERVAAGIVWVVNYFFFASAYLYFVSTVAKQKSLLRSSRETHINEKKRLELENTLLKAQINPHFLYNTLNFLYAKSLPLSPELSEGIMKLSDIMRHSLQSHDNEGLIVLSDEVKQMRNLVDLAKLRFNDGIYIEIAVDGSIDGLKIIPFVLTTLLENVLKHGLLTDPTTPAIVRLEVLGTQEIRFHTWNRNKPGPKELSASIGSANTVQMLRNRYGDDFYFDIINTEEIYQTDLRIKIG